MMTCMEATEYERLKPKKNLQWIGIGNANDAQDKFEERYGKFDDWYGTLIERSIQNLKISIGNIW